MTTEQDRLTVLYDAQCGLCTITVERLRKLPTRAELIFLPLQEAGAAQLPSGIQYEDMLAELHVIDGPGSIYRGADAVIRIVTTIPALAWLAPLYRLPGLRPIAYVLYRFIAKHRYRLFGRRSDQCDSGSCNLHHKERELPAQGGELSDKGDST
jgi:predicted DCC family thiol-disulfide oxidoreductase YuxK